MRDSRRLVSLWFMLVPIMGFIEMVFVVIDLIENKGLYTGGTFINSGPSACFLACTAPLTLRMYRNIENRIGKVFTLVIQFGYCMIIPLSLSRTAIFAVTAGLTVCFFQKLRGWFYDKRINKRKWLIIFSALIILVVATLINIKPASAHGRFFIWKIALPLIFDIPWNGVGWHFVEVTYNNAQELYFHSHQLTNAEANIAGSTNYLFNDFFTCAIAFGVNGVAIALGMFVSVIVITYKKRQWEILGGIVGFAIVMSGSYPLHCLQFLILGFVLWTGVFLLLRNKIISATLILVTAAIFYFLISAQRKPDYNMVFANAVALNKKGNYGDSNKLLNGYLKYRVSDIRVLYLIGRNYQATGEADSAEFYYKKAVYRVPSRHYPHYLLMNLYSQTGKDSLALKEASFILEQPPKVKSQAIEEMRYRAACYIHSLDSKQ